MQKIASFGAYSQKSLNNTFYLNFKMNNTTFAVIAVVAAMALLGVVAITLVTIPIQMEQAEAVGCKNSNAFNASKGRCFQP